MRFQGDEQCCAREIPRQSMSFLECVFTGTTGELAHDSDGSLSAVGIRIGREDTGLHGQIGESPPQFRTDLTLHLIGVDTCSCTVRLEDLPTIRPAKELIDIIVPHSLSPDKAFLRRITRLTRSFNSLEADPGQIHWRWRGTAVSSLAIPAAGPATGCWPQATRSPRASEGSSVSGHGCGGRYRAETKPVSASRGVAGPPPAWGRRRAGRGPESAHRCHFTRRVTLCKS
jgi:hypothetical protein